MNTFFEVTAKYTKLDENGREKKASETYLLDAVSFTEAEAKIFKELEKMISGDFLVTKIARTKISEIIPSETGDRWFKVKVSFIYVDEDSGRERKTSQQMLVFSDTVDNAYIQTMESMQDMMVDFKVSIVSESNIIEVFTHNWEDEDDRSPEADN